MHADGELVVNGGDISVLESYEGIENTVGDMTINGGRIYIVSDDDGLNVTGAAPYLYLNGGEVVIHATGDGLDSNGNIVMNDGRAIVNGALVRGTSPVDYDRGQFQMNGGFLAGTGSSSMAQGPGESSWGRDPGPWPGRTSAVP